MLPDDDNSVDLDDSFERRKNREDEDDEAKANRIAEIKEVPFVECRRIYFDPENLMKQGEGVDFYLDQLRYPPDTATFTRLLIRGLTKKQEKVINAYKCFPEINDSTRMIQNFEFRMEVRPTTLIQPKQYLDPTTFLEIMVETIDRVDFNEKILGFAYFPLFLVQDGSQWAYDESVTDYIPDEGHHQIPIYTERVEASEITL